MEKRNDDEILSWKRKNETVRGRDGGKRKKKFWSRKRRKDETLN